MTRTLMALSLGIGLMLAATPHAFAATCGPHDQVVARLAQQFGENRRATGLAANGLMVEIFASAATGTWTITLTRPDGATCLAAAGEAFQPVDDPLPPPGDPA